MTTWSNISIAPGTIVKGKWRGGIYRIVRLLGEGANGRVYLVRRGSNTYALKMGFDSLDLQMEVNALLSLSKTSSMFRGYFLESDDLELDGKRVPFFVMKYIPGVTIREYLKRRGRDWLYVIGLNLLDRLRELHKRGFIYGDMKLENVLVYGYAQVELIDFGGMSEKGRSVKQFTELYDRGAWNAGDRVAEDTYDLFSLAVLLLIAVDQKLQFNKFQQMLPQNRSAELLLALVKENPRLSPLYDWFKKALEGTFADSQEAADMWRKLVLDRRIQTRRDPGIAAPWLKVMFTASLALCIATVCYFWLR
ncbi:serine/threonine protein kinase [Paenibacillus chartarius]|uniref:non-specific serine/threonine protein kinase n=1 Tax=Paenibacillus chartarius TaxID=747481 RepID=A0ABV6DTX7_9BACL